MDNLGLAVYDAEGNLRPLNETFSDLNAIMAGRSGRALSARFLTRGI